MTNLLGKFEYECIHWMTLSVWSRHNAIWAGKIRFSWCESLDIHITETHLLRLVHNRTIVPHLVTCVNWLSPHSIQLSSTFDKKSFVSTRFAYDVLLMMWFGYIAHLLSFVIVIPWKILFKEGEWIVYLFERTIILRSTHAHTHTANVATTKAVNVIRTIYLHVMAV